MSRVYRRNEVGIKPSSGGGGSSELSEIETPVDSWYQPTTAVFELPVTIVKGSIADFTLEKLAETEHTTAELVRTSDTTGTIIFTRNDEGVTSPESEIFQLSNAYGVTKQLTVRMTSHVRKMNIDDAKVTDRHISFTFSGEIAQSTTTYYASEVLNISVRGILDESGAAVDVPLEIQVSAPVGYFGEILIRQHNLTLLEQTIDIFLLEDFAGTVEISITGKYSGVSTSQTLLSGALRRN